jgi:FkbM family methyltransferase
MSNGSSHNVMNALAQAGANEPLRIKLLDALRVAELGAANPADFRAAVRWPLVQCLLAEANFHRVKLKNGLVVEVGLDSRIEQALMLSLQAEPDHVWEPQTTRLLLALAANACHILVGGAYIGDQVLPLAQALANQQPIGMVHAFEPMNWAYRRLLRNVQLNNLENVMASRLALWDQATTLTLQGHAALASTTASRNDEFENSTELVDAVTVDDYVQAKRLPSIDLIMLDIEGGEEKALRGAQQLLRRSDAPHLVFEVHRDYVDWSNGLEQTPIALFLTAHGYTAYAIRDLQNNYSMAGRSIEIIPLDRVYLNGPPHGFNLLATKDASLVCRLGLRVVKDVSPKLLVDNDPALHHPLDGIPLAHSQEGTSYPTSNLLLDRRPDQATRATIVKSST